MQSIDTQQKKGGIPVEVSIIIPSCGGGMELADCIRSIIRSDCQHPYEIIVVYSAGVMGEEVKTLEEDNTNIRVLTFAESMSAGEARNMGARVASSDILLFVDADCTVEQNWVKEALAAIQEAQVVAVEGKVLYEKENPSLSDYVPVNPFYNLSKKGFLNEAGKDFCSANFAVKKEIFTKIGGFNYQRYKSGREDTDLGERLKREGKVAESPKMLVTHKHQQWTLSMLLRNAARYRYDVMFFKDHRFFFFKSGPFLHPRLLMALLFPPLIVFYFRPKRMSDIVFIPKLLFYLLAVRLNIWSSALKERVFLV